MAWFNADDKMHSHPKSRIAGLEAMGLWLLAGTYSAEFGPYGFVGYELVSSFHRGKSLARKLVNAALWVRVPGGWQFTDLWKVSNRERATIPDALRQAVYARDGFMCKHCGTDENLSLDHIWPWSLFGSDTYENLQTLCRPCNSRKGAKVVEGHPAVLHGHKRTIPPPQMDRVAQ